MPSKVCAYIYLYIYSHLLAFKCEVCLYAYVFMYTPSEREREREARKCHRAISLLKGRFIIWLDLVICVQQA